MQLLLGRCSVRDMGKCRGHVSHPSNQVKSVSVECSSWVNRPLYDSLLRCKTQVPWKRLGIFFQILIAFFCKYLNAVLVRKLPGKYFFPPENSLLSIFQIFCGNTSTSKEYYVKWHSWSKQAVMNSTWFKYVKLSGNSRTGKRFLRAEDVQNYNPGKRIRHPLNCDLPVKKNKTTKNSKKQRS